MTIKEVANLYGITENKLRFYEKKGLLQPKRDPDNGYRIYAEIDLLKIQTILTYRILEMPIEDIKGLLENHEQKTLITNVFNQWEMVNASIHKYRRLQGALETIIDELLGGEDNDLNMNNIINTASEFAKAVDFQSAWTDKWNFDDWASTYDETVYSKENSGVFESYETVLNAVYQNSTKGLGSDSKILEIGVGTGNLAVKYLKDGLDIVGVDQSRQMLFEAKKKYPKMKLYLGEFLKLPFDNQVFDRIVSTYALHHLTDAEKDEALVEMVRVLKPKGQIVIGDLMFEDINSRKAYCETLTPEDLAKVEDEFYTDINLLTEAADRLGYDVYAEKIDKLIYILTVVNRF